jgi:hypothetical protein
MPATVTTIETFDPSIPEASIRQEIALRIQAGAIRSWIDRNAARWTVKTEWNVVGQNDPG